MKIGFIGAGNMGSAIIGGIVKNNISDNIIVYDKNKEGLVKLSDKFGINIAKDNIEVVKESDILFLAIKPNILYDVIDEIKDDVNEETVIVSIVAGQSIEKIENAFGKNIKLVRVMPNTPALIGEGMSALCKNADVTDKDMEVVLNIFKGIGVAEEVSEYMMDAVTAVSGSSPAYVFMFIEAMADAAVMGGMPRAKAYTFAAQAVVGSAKMILETGMHPGALKDMVTSPGGTTIEGCEALERGGMRYAVIDCINVATEKSKRL